MTRTLRTRLPAADQLRRACIEREIIISADGYVRERDAAALLGRSANTLKSWRTTAQPIPHRLFLGRTEYSLADLADFITSNGQKFGE